MINIIKDMRTTLTLDDELARELKEAAELSHRSFEEVVNETLRKGLGGGARPTPVDLPPFKVQPISTPFRDGVDPHNLKRLLDDLEVEDFQREMAEVAGQQRDRE